MNEALTIERILEEVESQAGGTQHCDPEFRLRLTALLHHLDQDLGLDESGKRAAYELVVDIASNREAALADRERYPEIKDEIIYKPLIIIGIGRSGTTLMHALLGEHPDNRVPMHWEAVRPSPPPGLSAADDPRIAKTNAEVTAYIHQSPEALPAHPYLDMGGCSPIECAGFGALDFRNVYPLLYWKVPGIPNIDLAGDELGTYQFEYEMLQNLQYRRPQKRWVLKGVHHHGRVTALKDVFQDSIVVWMHRDPLKVLPSMLSTRYQQYKTSSDKPVDAKEIGERLFNMAHTAITTGMQSPYIDDPSVCHIRYADFMKDPVATIEGIYDRYQLPFEGAADAINGWLNSNDNRGDRYGKWTYEIENFGTTDDDIDSAFAQYHEKFNIPYE